MQLGMIAEYQYIVDASKRGNLVSKPTHDNRGYDFINHGKKRLYKIQVKSTRAKCKNLNYYKVIIARGSSNKNPYKKEHVDFFAVYLFDLSRWYIIPFNAVTSKNIRIYPENPNHKFSKFLEAWHLIK